MDLAIVLLSGIGCSLSLYALHVKKQLGKRKRYTAFCDINEKLSCTKALGSKYGELFLLPNSVFGVLFYALLALLGAFDELLAVFYLSVLAALGSLYLAYVSFFKLKIACPICMLTYVINVLLLIASW